MKVTMVTTLAGPGSVAGGVWEVVTNQSQALLAEGHDVSIVAGWLGRETPRTLRGLEVRLVPVQPLVKPLGLRGLRGRGWGTAVRRAVEGADIAHVHLCRDYLTMHATRVISTVGTPMVSQTHGMITPPRSAAFAAFDRTITKPAIRRCRQFITLTDAEKPDLQHFGVREHQLTTIHNCVARPPVTWKRPDAATRRLLFASRLHPRKQVMVFAETVARLRADGHPVEGVIAGPDHGDLPRLLAYIRSGGHQDHLHYLGELDQTRLAGELARADAFVFPALDEPFGLVLVEAMAVGTPVVSTTQTPLAEDLRRHGAALIGEPDAAGMTAALDQLLRDADLQAALARRGHDLYEQRWTNAATVVDLSKVYADAINGR